MSKAIMQSESGFTLVEVLMAMAVFSFMLTIILVGFLSVVRTHESGVVQRSTQQNARLALDQVEKIIHSSAEATTSTANGYPVLCLKQAGQTQVLEIQPQGSGKSSRNTLTLGTIPSSDSCHSAASFSYQALTDATVTVPANGFVVNPIAAEGSSLGAVTVTLTVASIFGTNYLDSTGSQCLTTPGSQYCSVTTLDASAALQGGFQQ